AGANVTVTLTASNGAVVSQYDGVPLVLSGTTDGSGHFAVTFTSQSAGIVLGNATETLSVLGVNLTRATGDGQAGDTGAATKRFVDAQVSIAPNATNGITEPHTFTVTVLQDDGLTAAQGGDGVTGFTAASGANVAVTLTGAGGAGAILESGSLTGTTDGSGHF